MEFSGRVGSSSDMSEVQVQHMPQDHVDGQMLCREIGAVAFARDLREGNHLLRALFLEPQALHADVTYLGYSLTVKYALAAVAWSSRVILRFEPMSMQRVSATNGIVIDSIDLQYWCLWATASFMCDSSVRESSLSLVWINAW